MGNVIGRGARMKTLMTKWAIGRSATFNVQPVDVKIPQHIERTAAKDTEGEYYRMVEIDDEYKEIQEEYKKLGERMNKWKKKAWTIGVPFECEHEWTMHEGADAGETHVAPEGWEPFEYCAKCGKARSEVEESQPEED